jgi:hypothetical protein
MLIIVALMVIGCVLSKNGLVKSDYALLVKVKTGIVARFK